MLILKELLRFSSQHRTMYCYLVLWIFLLIIFYVCTENGANLFNNKTFYTNNKIISDRNEERMRIKKHTEYFCNNVLTVLTEKNNDEGGFIENWSLQGVILVIRHGIRSPLVHVRNINAVDCSYENDSLLTKYRNYLLNASNPGHASWSKQGPFHGFPMLPLSNLCLLGQLTNKGISQLLHIGQLLKYAYGNSLDLYHKTPVPVVAPKTNINISEAQLLHAQMITNSEDIIIFTTRYRRTFQSAMALLYNLLPNDRWQNLNVQESHSLSFCFSDCACPNAEYLKKVLSKSSSKELMENQTISSLVSWLGTSLQTQEISSLNPLDVRDALLTYLCHDQEFPCQSSKKNSNRKSDYVSSSVQREDNSNDVINIDLDESPMQPNIIATTANDGDDDSSVEETTPSDPIDNCIEQRHVDTLLAYTNYYELKESNNKMKIIERLLRGYGLIRNIVSFMLKMISGDKTKFVLYSSHDHTLKNLLSVLGMIDLSSYIPYAARLSFEVYRSDKDNQHYFRLIYNGKDLTSSISFCLGGKSLRVKRGRGGIAFLCPIENIIRFVHDDYFLVINATNYKDACASKESYT